MTLLKQRDLRCVWGQCLDRPTLQIYLRTDDVGVYARRDGGEQVGILGRKAKDVDG